MSTIVISVRPDVTQGTGPPRAVHVRFPMGNPVGEAEKPDQQRRILQSVLEILPQVPRGELMYPLPYRWRRMKV